MPDSNLIESSQREKFLAGGEAPNVLDADAQAWRALESCLGRDPVEAWTLASIVHAYKGPGYIEWQAEWQRDPDFPVPPVTVKEISDDELKRALADVKGEKAAAGKGPRS